jgi:hypothetical protein
MELEDDLRKLRWGAPPPELRGRVLRDARAAGRVRLVPPWFASLECHWLYPGRIPAAAVVALWLVILSLRVTTPVSLLPGPVSHLSDADMARIEIQRAELLAALREDDFAPRQPPQPGRLSPQS